MLVGNPLFQPSLKTLCAKSTKLVLAQGTVRGLEYEMTHSRLFQVRFKGDPVPFGASFTHRRPLPKVSTTSSCLRIAPLPYSHRPTYKHQSTRRSTHTSAFHTPLHCVFQNQPSTNRSIDHVPNPFQEAKKTQKSPTPQSDFHSPSTPFSPIRPCTRLQRSHTTAKR